MENVFVKPIIAVADLASNNKGTAIVSTLAGAAVAVIDFKALIFILFGLMLFDFITGIMASYKEYFDLKNIHFRKVSDFTKNWGNVVKSEKLKKSGVKFFLYAGTVLMAYLFENILFIKMFSLGFSEAKFTLSSVIAIFWCLVEVHSIFFENFKRMGFSIIKKVKDIKEDVQEIKENINEVKG